MYSVGFHLSRKQCHCMSLSSFLIFFLLLVVCSCCMFWQIQLGRTEEFRRAWEAPRRLVKWFWLWKWFRRVLFRGNLYTSRFALSLFEPTTLLEFDFLWFSGWKTSILVIGNDRLLRHCAHSQLPGALSESAGPSEKTHLWVGRVTIS